MDLHSAKGNRKEVRSRAAGRETRAPEDADQEIHVEDRRFWTREEAEGDDTEGGYNRLPSYVEELQAQVRAAEERLNETLSAHRRVQAEFDAARARLNRDFEERVRQAKAGLFRRLLEIADNMDLALEAAGADRQDGSLAEGVRLIHGRLLAALKDEGVERVETEGEPFDPEIAEAVAVVPVGEPERHDRVVRELRAGYRLGEVTIRPAQVQVGRHAGDPATPPAEESEPGR